MQTHLTDNQIPSISTIKRRRDILELYGSRSQKGKLPNHEVEQIVVNQLDSDLAKGQGVGTVKARLAFDQGIHIPRDQVRDVMRLHEPEGFECRNPGSRKVHRTPIVPLGIHERWTADGHDKLYSIGFPIWAILDFGSQKALGAWVVPSNRLAIVIAYLFLCVVEKYRGLCSSIRSIIIKLIFLLFRNTLGDIHQLWIGDNAVIWLC